MKKLLSIAVFCLTALIIVSLYSCTPSVPKAKLLTEIDSLSYALGVQWADGLENYYQQVKMEEQYKGEFFKGFLEGANVNTKDKKTFARVEGRNIGKQLAIDMLKNMSENLFGNDETKSLNKEQYIAGFFAAAQNKDLLMPKEEVPMYVQNTATQIQAKANEALQAEGQTFLNENRKKEGVIQLESGLQYKVIKEGTGPKPTADDAVKVKYRGTLVNGEEFDSNEEVVFPLGNVIRGWTEGIQLMSVGSKYMLYVPYYLGYGERGSMPNIKPYATLIFDVELLEIVKK